MTMVIPVEELELKLPPLGLSSDSGPVIGLVVLVVHHRDYHYHLHYYRNKRQSRYCSPITI